MSKTILFLTFLGIAHLLPAQNRPFRLALNVGFPMSMLTNPDRSIHLSINPQWLRSEKTYFEGEAAYSYMHYSPSTHFFSRTGQTFQCDALVGFRYYLIGVSHPNHIKPYIIRPYITASAGYSYIKDEHFRDGSLHIEHHNLLQLVGSVNLEIKKHFLLTFSARAHGFLMVTRIGYQF
jgi:hypothetical protein